MSEDFEPGECEVVDSIIFDVRGVPGPQGSKTLTIGRSKRTGKRTMGMRESSKKVKPWRKRIALRAREEARKLEWKRREEGPVRVVIQFFMKAPKAPKWKRLGVPDRMPDIDKLARSTLDGLSDSKAIWGDDNQVVDLHCIERYADDTIATGARINIVSLRERAKPRKKVKKSLVS